MPSSFSIPDSQLPDAAARRRGALTDGCSRLIDHLRLSLTDRCNLACPYCVVPGTRRPTHRIDADFAIALVRWLSSRHGIRHVRLTGGEPLLYPDLLPMIEASAALGTLREITLTTNAQLLVGMAQSLRRAGLTRINASLDTLDPARFGRLTGGGQLSRTLEGIQAAVEAGLTPVRINVLVQRGLNDDELCELAEWGLTTGCTVRFLEIMPIGAAVGTVDDRLVPAAEIYARLATRFQLRARPCPPGQPATEYQAIRRHGLPLAGRVGVIAATTRPFCASCRRIRITARGELLSCLFDSGGSDLAAAWDGHTLDQDRADAILYAAVMAKPALGLRTQATSMMAIGG